MSLESLAEIATILSVVAGGIGLVWRYVIPQCGLRHQTRQLETILRTKTAPNDDSLTLAQLAAHFGMTEEQVIKAASRSRVIQPWGGQLGNERRYRIKR
jgi:hypothetical protein